LLQQVTSDKHLIRYKLVCVPSAEIRKNKEVTTGEREKKKEIIFKHSDNTTD
jgi:hypothetical protein